MEFTRTQCNRKLLRLSGRMFLQDVVPVVISFQSAAKAASPTQSSATPAITPPPFVSTLANGSIQVQTSVLDSFYSAHPLSASAFNVTVAPSPTASFLAVSTTGSSSTASQTGSTSLSSNALKDVVGAQPLLCLIVPVVLTFVHL
jgi:hypothetical protein